MPVRDGPRICGHSPAADNECAASQKPIKKVNRSGATFICYQRTRPEIENAFQDKEFGEQA